MIKTLVLASLLTALSTHRVRAQAAQADAPAPGEPPQAPQQPGEGARGATEGASRAFLERRLEESRAETARLEAALHLVESGAPPEEIRRALMPARPRAGDGSMRPDRPGAGPERRHDRMGRAPMPPEARERILAFLRERAPEAAERLTALRAERPMLAERMLDEIGEQLQELRGLSERSPEMFGVRLRAIRTDWDLRRLAFDHARARHEAANGGAPADEDDFRKRAAELFTRRFDIGLEERALQVKEMEQRLGRLKAEVDEGADRRDEIVRAQVERMLEHLDRAPTPDEHERPRRAQRRADEPPPPAGEGDPHDPPAHDPPPPPRRR